MCHFGDPRGRSPGGSSTAWERTVYVIMEQVVVIGTGCAGLTAAIYAARSNLSPLVLTGLMPGGLLTTTSTVENYPGFPEGVDGYELMTRMQKQAERLARASRCCAHWRRRTFPKPVCPHGGRGEDEAKTVIIATGASGPRRLGLESERLLETKGVTFCATCDGAWPDVPQSAAGGRRRRGLRLRGGALPDSVWLRNPPGPPAGQACGPPKSWPGACWKTPRIRRCGTRR